MADENYSEQDRGHRDGVDHYEYRDTESPSTAVVEAVAATTGRDPLDLPVLQRIVDTDALDALVSRATNTDEPTRVSFTYASVDVVVDSDDGIAVWTDLGR